MSIRIAIAPGDRVFPWMNQCPPTWSLRPLKYAAKINARTLGENTPPDFEINYIDISSVDSNGHRSSAETMSFGEAPSRARRIVVSGDVIISTVRTYLKAISYIDTADDNLICSTGFAVITPSPKLYPRFLFYWVCSEWFVSEIVARSVGVSYPAMNAVEVGNLPCPAIPMGEQQAVAEFLDHETARIDELIAKKQRLIELLQEQRRALITHMVTKGLNPDAPKKDSGVEWLGAIPAHWDVKKLKYLCSRSAIYGANESSNAYIESGIRLLRTSDIDDNGGLVDDNPVHIDPSSVQDYRLSSGDLLLSRSGTIGRSFLYDKNRHGECAYAGYLVRFVPNKRLIPKFAFYFTKSSTFQDWLRVSVIQSTIGNVNGWKYANMPMPTTEVTEQQAVVSFLDRETGWIDALTGRINQAIEKLQEYRSALITAAVTGKIDVRRCVSRG